MGSADRASSHTVPILPRTVAAGVPAAVLHPAWQEAAERGDPALVLTAGAEGEAPTVAWANRSLVDLLGLDAEELLGAGLPPGEHAPRPGGGAGAGPRTAPASARSWAAVARELLHGLGGERPGVVRRADETAVPVHVSVSAVPASAALAQRPVDDQAPGQAGDDASPGRPGGTWLVTVRPVLDGPAELQAALREAEHRFAALAGSAPIGIFLSEAGLRIGYANERFGELLGLGRHRLLGTGWLDAVHREDLPPLHDALVGVLGGAAAELAVRVADPAGDVTTPGLLELDGVASGRRWISLRLAPTTTPARAAGFIGTAEDVTERRAWEERITYQAHHDPLTGLVNRRRLIEALQQMLSSRRSRDREFAVLFLDLDGFKQVNDTFGHEAGDRVLIEVARRLQRTAREFDLLARVAGDEFVVVLRAVSHVGEAEAAAQRHLAALAEPLFIGRHEVPLSASVGVAVPASFDTPESLLRAADRVMYDAKAAGQGGYRLAPVGPAGGPDAGDAVHGTMLEGA